MSIPINRKVTAEMFDRNYILMNRNTPVCAFTMGAGGATIEVITEVYNISFAPLGAFKPMTDGEALDVQSLTKWYQARSIPENRIYLRHVLDKLDISVTELIVLNRALSLTDCYWLKVADESVTWEDVNFFDNDFSPVVGEALLYPHAASNKQTVSASDLSDTPDGTTPGVLAKMWTIENSKRILIKGGTASLYQEPYNEVIATALFERLFDKTDYVSYRLLIKDGLPYSQCEDFCDGTNELVPAKQIIAYGYPKSSELYDRYSTNCVSLGLDLYEVRVAVSKMLIGDHIMLNQDRHTNNFGLIRDASTLKIQGVCPLYDNGYSLYHLAPLGADLDRQSVYMKPFDELALRQLALATETDWYDPQRMEGFVDEVREIFKDSPVESVPGRLDQIVSGITRRIGEVTSHCAS
jgi:hypothetical protein